MAYLRSFMTLLTGVSVGVPSAIAIKKVTSFEVPIELKKFSSAIQLEWTGKDMQEEIGKLINGFGGLIHKNDQDNKTANVLGIKLSTWSSFDKDVCKKIGLGNKKEKGINCYRG